MGFQKKKKKKFLVGLEREWKMERVDEEERKNNGSEFLYLLKRRGEGGNGWMGYPTLSSVMVV